MGATIGHRCQWRCRYLSIPIRLWSSTSQLSGHFLFSLNDLFGAFFVTYCFVIECFTMMLLNWMTTSLQNMLQRYNNFCINARKWRFFAIFSLEDAPKALQAIGYRLKARGKAGIITRLSCVWRWSNHSISSASGIGVVTGKTRELLTTMSVN